MLESDPRPRKTVGRVAGGAGLLELTEMDILVAGRALEGERFVAYRFGHSARKHSGLQPVAVRAFHVHVPSCKGVAGLCMIESRVLESRNDMTS